MTKLFNKGGDGAGEIVRVLGLIDDDLDFTKWEPILPLGIRDLQAIIGTRTISPAPSPPLLNNFVICSVSF